MVSGYVLRPLEIDPSELNLGILSPEGFAEGIVNLYSPYGQTILALEVENSMSQVLSWRIEGSEGMADRVRVRVTARGEGLENVRTGTVVKGVFWFQAKIGHDTHRVRLEVYGAI